MLKYKLFLVTYIFFVLEIGEQLFEDK